jgi:hypothetical protein
MSMTTTDAVQHTDALGTPPEATMEVEIVSRISFIESAIRLLYHAQSNAVTLIQKWVRGHVARCMFMRTQHSIIVIQAVARGMVTRRRGQHTKAPPSITNEQPPRVDAQHKAATHIQKMVRGHVARRALVREHTIDILQKMVSGMVARSRNHKKLKADQQEEHWTPTYPPAQANQAIVPVPSAWERFRTFGRGFASASTNLIGMVVKPESTTRGETKPKFAPFLSTFTWAMRCVSPSSLWASGSSMATTFKRAFLMTLIVVLLVFCLVICLVCKWMFGSASATTIVGPTVISLPVELFTQAGVSLGQSIPATTTIMSSSHVVAMVNGIAAAAVATSESAFDIALVMFRGTTRATQDALDTLNTLTIRMQDLMHTTAPYRCAVYNAAADASAITADFAMRMSVHLWWVASTVVKEHLPVVQEHAKTAAGHVAQLIRKTVWPWVHSITAKLVQQLLYCAVKARTWSVQRMLHNTTYAIRVQPYNADTTTLRRGSFYANLTFVNPHEHSSPFVAKCAPSSPNMLDGQLKLMQWPLSWLSEMDMGLCLHDVKTTHVLPLSDHVDASGSTAFMAKMHAELESWF